MAENKKSFMFYCDWQETFNALPREKAGDLIVHLLAYVNDENPETDDFVIKAVFANMKLQLKRDLEKWEKKCEINAQNGKKGGRPKGSLNNPKKPKKTQKNPTVKNKTQDKPNETQPIPKKPDTDTDTDIDIDTSTIVEVEEKRIADFNNKLLDIDKLQIDYLQNKRVVEAVIANPKNKFKNKMHLEKRLKEFVVSQKQNGDTSKTMADFAKHFRYWHIKMQGIVVQGEAIKNTIPIG